MDSESSAELGELSMESKTEEVPDSRIAHVQRIDTGPERPIAVAVQLR
jgi:hypothetical protein